MWLLYFCTIFFCALLLLNNQRIAAAAQENPAGDEGQGEGGKNPLFENNGGTLSIRIQPSTLSLTVGESAIVQFSTTDELANDVELMVNMDESFNATPDIFIMDSVKRSTNITIKAIKITSFSIIEIQQCRYIDSVDQCPFGNLKREFVEIRVVHSKTLSVLVIVVGWIYFVAWSISFYPQIYLNCKRKSVVGLNFDFLLLNIIGFSCYTFYNVLMFFDSNVQDLYEISHPHTHIPVLLNDVVFAAHALFACLVTALQCFFYQRGNQRVSYICMGISSALILFAGLSFVLTISKVINALQFIMFLSYIKMGATLCKYFPQAFFNFRRKSTVGWSIGNVLLDFLGGSMDICQMILQATNTDDWSAFFGNPVKFGLGLISMLFDIVFMLQHYVLYRHKNYTDNTVATNSTLQPPSLMASTTAIATAVGDTGNSVVDADPDADQDSSAESSTAPSDDGSSVPIYVDRTNNPIV